MKKKILTVLIVSFLIINIISGIEPKVRLYADFWSNPFYFENTHTIYGGSFNGSIMVGARLDKFTVGAQIDENYFTFTGKNNGDDLEGAWNILRGTVVGYYEPISWFELKWGLGGAWKNSAYKTTTFGTVNTPKGGLSFVLDGLFRPMKYLDISVVNTLDIYITAVSVETYYYGGLRLIFHPVLKWLNLYIEAGGMPWLYSDDNVEIQSGVFLWGVGISIDLTFPDSIKYTKNLKASKRNIVGEDLGTDKKIEKLSNAKKGDIISFSDIIFFPNSDRIKEESYPVLDKIAKVLIKREAIVIEIGGYTNFVNNPDAELELSVKRSIKVAQYLSGKGVSAYRMKAAGYGGLKSKLKSDGVEEANRRVEIKILKVGQ